MQYFKNTQHAIQACKGFKREYGSAGQTYKARKCSFNESYIVVEIWNRSYDGRRHYFAAML